MSVKKPNISQINKYLQGKLDTRAMNQLERQAQDDLFLMDALEGYENAGKNQQHNLADLKGRLVKRIAPAKQRSIFLWRVLPIAATVLLLLGAGYWFFKLPSSKEPYAYKVNGYKPIIPPPLTVDKQIVVDSKDSNLAKKKTHKTDQYIAHNSSVKTNALIEDILKRTESLEVTPDGSVNVAGKVISKVKLNGKDFLVGDPVAATKNLPADIVENLQISDTLTKKDLIVANKPSPQLKDVSISAPVTNNRTISGKVLDQQGAPLAGASVKVDGTGNGVATDVNGNFKIDLPANKDLIAVNYVGYSPLQLKVGNQNNLNIELQADGNSLNEVVVVGYGLQKKASVVGSIACNENLKFKTQFFDYIAVAEKYTNENVAAIAHTIKTANFKEALTFLNKYTKVPADGMNNEGYKTLQAFNTDKEEWLKWYEANKCNNLK